MALFIHLNCFNSIFTTYNTFNLFIAVLILKIVILIIFTAVLPTMSG
jgi:hypothetical protein